ncbi:MAG: chemotaxis protein [Devosia sp.]|nr:chemotaxis protein [Devosia sp.]MDB5588629.1 chemotaxis protein [Devosia sp.]
MFGLPLGFFVESAVAVLMALTIGYCVVLNSRLKRLHADRSVLQQMVADLVGATNLANQAIKELKTTAMDADLALTARLEEAERFGIELANHVSAGSMLMERIAKITSIARSHPVAVEPALEETNKVQSALQQLNARARARENAA